MQNQINIRPKLHFKMGKKSGQKSSQTNTKIAKIDYKQGFKSQKGYEIRINSTKN